MSRRAMAGWAVAVVAVLTVLAAAYVVFVLPLGGLRSAPAPSPSPTPVFTPAPPVLASLVISPPDPDAPQLPEVLDSLVAANGLGDHVGAAVFDLESGEQVYGHRADSGFTPASTVKILTATAALESLGPEHRFTTRVVEGGSPDEIVLVGGGDPLLTAATADPDVPDDQLVPRPTRITALAAATADQLRLRSLTSVRLGVDDTLFTGPDTSPDWPNSYVGSGVVGRVSALSLDGGRAKPDGDRRVKDPALHAAGVFVRHLEAAGIEVVGEPVRTSASPSAASVASVESATVASIVEWVLAVSDNDGAEMLGRHVAVAAGQPASFEGATAAISAVLMRLGIDLSGATLRDASGLSRDTRVTPHQLAAVIVTAADQDNGRLRATITGLPVAGFSGSLTERFERRSASDGVGIVRAKTGTLTGVSAMAGIAPSADGTTYAFAVIADDVSTGTDAARRALDRVGAALAECGCDRPQTAAPSTPGLVGQSAEPAPVDSPG